jgi:hypothetical protein
VNEVILNTLNERETEKVSPPIQRRQGIIDDLAFQVTVIDSDGIMIFFNLPNRRLVLS